jgi:hypothetical protein
MKIAITAAALGAFVLFSVSGAIPARASDINDYRWDPHLSNCRDVEIHTTNRWGDDVTIHRRVCD